MMLIWLRHGPRFWMVKGYCYPDYLRIGYASYPSRRCLDESSFRYLGGRGTVESWKLQPGEFVIRNNDGTRNSHTDHAEVMFSLDGKGQENAGNVIGAALVYSGNYKLKTVTDDTEYHYFFAGINEQNSEYHLKKGETFKLQHSLWPIQHRVWAVQVETSIMGTQIYLGTWR